MKVTLALPKGRLFEESVDLLIGKGILKERIEESRKLVIEKDKLKIILAKPFDVPVYVEEGVADIGIVGRDVLLEKKPKVYEFGDLGIGKCKIVVAGKENDREKYKTSPYIRVATKYPNLTKSFFEKKNVKAGIIHLNGSVELAPILGLSDFIVDLVQTGRTLRENNLTVIEEISESTGVLIGNRVSFIAKRELIIDIIRKIFSI